jgi:virginiamycin B lyase
MSYPSAGTLAAETVASTWTPFGVSKTVSSTGNTYQSDVIIDSLNRPTDICMSGPCATVGTVKSRFAYLDSDGTQRLQLSEFGRVGSAATASSENTYDAAGNITMLTEAGVEKQCFNYDGRARLVRGWATSVAGGCDDPGFAAPGVSTGAPYRQQFGYSAIHNIEQRTDDSGAAKVYQYPAQGGVAPATIGAGPRPHAPISILPQFAGVNNSGRFTSLATPTRILDTRAATRSGKCPTLATQCLTLVPNVALTVKVAGEEAIPATGVSGVEAILTTLSPVTAGTITVTGTGYAQASEYAAGGARNMTVAPVLNAGNITIMSTTAVDVVFDVSGWYSDATGPTGSVFMPLQVRALDTRAVWRQGSCPSTAVQCLPLSNTAPVLAVKVAGVLGVPANATAVRVVITAVSPTGVGELRVSPTGVVTATRFLDLSSPEWRSSTGVVKVGVGGTIDLSLVGTLTTDVAIDIAGYYVADPVGPVMVPVSGAANPFVVLNQDVALSETVGVRTGGYAGLPTSGVSSVVLAVTSNITKLGSGWATMWAGGQASPPAVGTMYWRAGESPTQIVVVPAGSDGRLNLFSSVAGRYSIKVLGHYSTPVTAGVTFTYDANGNRLTSVDALSGKTSTYTWDDTSRLTSVCTATTGVACSNPEEVNVYDADGQRLVRRSRSGVSPSQSVQPGFIPTTTSQSRDVHVAGAFMYWSNVNAGTIGRANIDGTGVNQSFITGIDAPSGITSDGTYLYWTTGGLNDTYGTGGVARAALDGVTGRNNTFITGASKPLAVSVDANYVYWANFNGSTIGRATIAGAGANQSFIAAGSYPYGLEVRGPYIYWSNFLLGTGASGNKIGRADVGGTNINLSFIGNAVGPTGLTSDGTFLYWTNYTNSTIGRSLLNGTGVDQAYVVPPTTAVADSFNPVGVAVTATNVLWTNLDAPKIGRAAFAGTGDQLTIFLDGQEIVNNPGSATVVSAARYYSGSGLLATRTTVGGLTYVGTDSQGTLTATLTTAGLSTRQRYKPFGEQRGTTNVLPSERGFVGQVEDTAAGLSYLNARHYDAKNATFISVDPVLSIFDSTSLNAYVYGADNPVVFSDPTGLEPCSWCKTGNEQREYENKTERPSSALKGEQPTGETAALEEYLDSKMAEVVAWAEDQGTVDCWGPTGNACYLANMKDVGQKFTGVVAPQMRFDLKSQHEMKAIIGKNNFTDFGDFSFASDTYGNIIYGWLGKMIGIREGDLMDGSHGTFDLPGPWNKKFDAGETQLADDSAVRAGFEMYDSCKKKCTIKDLVRELKKLGPKMIVDDKNDNTLNAHAKKVKG